MDYVAEAKELVRNLNQRMNPSAYDTAWLARLRTPDGEPRWPDLLDWLVENQKPDGSWGGEIVYYHDRILCTLTAIIALRENGHTRGTEEAIKRGERYLWHHLHLLPRDPFELVGFELIFPTLLEEARELGLDVPSHTCGYGEIQTAKLRLIPPDKLYSPKISTVHSLEFLGRDGDPDRLRQALAPNGSLGNSPATTAYYLMLLGYEDERAWEYLEEVQRQSGHVIYLYPFATFELAWVLNNIAFSKMPITNFVDQDVLESMYAEMTPMGVGLDPSFGIPDGDITSVYSRLLTEAGYDVQPSILASFEKPEAGVFRTYEYELNVSVGTNVHALEALRLMPEYPNRQAIREQVVLMLLDSQKFNTYWVDKWHTSPFYATSHALVALLNEGKHLMSVCRRSADWLIHTQHDDGSWGFFQVGTAEETAYAITALLHFNEYESVNKEVLLKGVEYLVKAYETEAEHPALWIGKCLYTPCDVVRSSVLTALILYEEMAGTHPL